jgi:SAM-dependent methyltransferase
VPSDHEELDDLFGDDYLYFYADYPQQEQTALEVELLRTLLPLPAGAEVLDLACGYGRIAIPLAQRGWRMTGLDRSATLLARARADARARGVEVEWILGDMRELAFRERFAAVLCWFTSFGYFEDDVLQGILRGAFASLAPGGTLLLETANRDRLLREFQDHFVLERNGDMLIDNNRFDPLTGRTHQIRTVFRDGETRTGEWSLRLFTFPELDGWLRAAGFGHVQAFGEGAEVFSLASERMIVLACK